MEDELEVEEREDELEAEEKEDVEEEVTDEEENEVFFPGQWHARFRTIFCTTFVIGHLRRYVF